MKATVLSSVAALTMIAGAAYAQVPLDNSATTTQTTTTTPAVAPPVSAYSTTQQQKTLNPDGTEVDKASSYSADQNGVKESSSEVTTGPDGSQVSRTQDVRTQASAPVPPPVATTTTTSSTTTTAGQ